MLLKNGTMYDHVGNQVTRDILIENGRIKKLGKNLQAEGHETVECEGKWIFPGFVDLHVHLREPGFEAKETIETGSMAAVKGGFTTIACMPNTKPVLDTPEQIRYIHEQTKKSGYAHVLPIGAITKRQLGEELNDFESMQHEGVLAVSDDGVGVQSSWMMKQAMIKAQELGLPVVAHCEDDTLIQGGCVHEGSFSEKYNLRGIPSECEAIHIGRDILLAEQTGVHYHVCHISTKESVRLVREGKKNGIKVTAEVSPHHLLLCEDDIPGLNTNFKMNPPLRGAADREALLEGLLDGTIDFIATDHAPHTEEEKAKSMELAPFGIVGLETAFPLLYTHFVQKGIFTLKQLVDWMTVIPADRFGLDKGRLTEGGPADITIVDLHKVQDIDPNQFASKGKNTPFAGWRTSGWPVQTIVAGELVWSEEQGFSAGNEK
ncbi:dihydroorotase [Bacillus horti]|uniref:Dihydroorotase n=1 Tax=Caldalkalibacillus horti TaxID=77523 RepID=A0ABT9VX47_9BACI|nr:dihydroorotase [Bacillus horti]